MSAVDQSLTGSRLALVRVAELKVDYTYQRPLDERRVASIASNYSAALAGVVDVSERENGDRYLVDGQHRAKGAQRAGEEFITAVVHPGLTVGGEARLFYLKNTTTRKPSAFSVFRARLGAGESNAVAIGEVCQSLGISIADGGWTHRSTKAVASLDRIFQLIGPAGLLATLRVLDRAFGDDRNAFDAVPIVAVGSFIAVYRSHPDYDEARISQKLGEKPARWLARRRIALSESSSSMSSTASAIDGLGVAVVLEAYNRGLRVRHLPAASPSEIQRTTKGLATWSAS